MHSPPEPTPNAPTATLAPTATHASSSQGQAEEAYAYASEPRVLEAAWLLFALQALLTLVCGWLFGRMASPLSFWALRLGVSDWMFPLLLLLVALLGWSVGVAACTSRDAFDAQARLSPLLWPQAAAVLLWSAVPALAAAAVPWYGGTFPPWAFALQAVVFGVVFAGLAGGFLVLLHRVRRTAG